MMRAADELKKLSFRASSRALKSIQIFKIRFSSYDLCNRVLRRNRDRTLITLNSLFVLRSYLHDIHARWKFYAHDHVRVDLFNVNNLCRDI